jgi:hypothetical protein
MPKKVAKDNAEEVEKDLDFGPYDKDDSEEEEAGQNITPKAAEKTTTKTKNSAQKSAEKAAKMERNKVLSEKAAAGLLTPEEQKELFESFKTKETTTRAKYDHETTMKNLIDDTEDTVARMKKFKDNYESVHYMGLLCEYWKSLLKMNDPENRAKKANDAFFKFFKKHQHFYGLPPATPAGSKTSSRAASVSPEEGEEVEEMEEIEEEEEEEEVEETK